MGAKQKKGDVKMITLLSDGTEKPVRGPGRKTKKVSENASQIERDSTGNARKGEIQIGRKILKP